MRYSVFFLTPFLAVIFLAPRLCAQVFEDVTESTNIQAGTSGIWGAGCAFVDFDQDGDDDVALLADGLAPKIYRNDGNGVFTLMSIFLDAEHNEMLTFTDYDNDSDLDIFLSQNGAPNYLYELMDDGSYVNVTADAGLPIINDPSYGHSWGDINNDGWLDLYVCNYITNDVLLSDNFLFLGSETGVFEDITNSAGVGDGLKSTFQSVFIDYDRDGYQDIFVANDRTPYENSLYHNNGDNTFTNLNFAANMGDYIWSMSNTVGDTNNDGLFEIYICNNADGNLMKSFDGVDSFDDVANDVGAGVNEFCWGAQFFDYDNDGWQDLYVNSTVFEFWNSYGYNHLYRNINGLSFDVQTAEVFETAEYNSNASCIGDLDGDGDLDLICHNQSAPDPGTVVWKNTMEAGNYLGVNLQGTVSNSMGIGSWIEAWYGQSEYQMQYVLCGEAYLAQNSYTEHFGLGDNETIDSLKISWLSGIEETYNDVAVNQTITLVEGGLEIPIYADGTLDICPGDTLILSTEEYLEYNWSNGSDSSLAYINDVGEYYVEITTSYNGVFSSDTLEVTASTQSDWTVGAILPDCYPDTTASLLIVGVDAPDASFSDTLSYNPSAITGGDWIWAVIDPNGCTYTGNYLFNPPLEILASESLYPSLCFGDGDGAFEIEASGGAPPLTVDYPEGNENLLPGSYAYLITDLAGCELSGEIELDEPDPLLLEVDESNVNEDGSGFLEVNVSGGTPPLVLSFNGEENPDNWNTSLGEQIILLTDSNGCTVEETLLITHVDDAMLHQVKLYPNPSTGLIQVSTPLSGSMDIFDQRGRLVYSSELRSGLQYIDLRKLASGIYNAHIWTSATYTRRLIQLNP